MKGLKRAKGRRYLVGIVILLCLIIPVLYFAIQSPEKRAERHFERARQYLQRQDIKAAEIELKNTVRYNQKHVEGHYLLGVLYDASGKYKDALREFESVYTLDPGFSDIMNLLESGYIKAGDFKGLLKFGKAVLKDDKLKGMTIAAMALSRLGKNPEAIEWINKAIRLDPLDPVPISIRGDIYTQLRKINEAIRDYKNALSLDYENAKVRYKLGMLYYSKGDLMAAIQQLNLSYNNERDFYPAGLQLSGMLIESGSIDRAIDVLNEMLSRNNSVKEISYLLGVAYLKKGMFINALEVLKDIEDQGKGDPGYHFLLSIIYAIKNDLSGAMDEVEKSLKASPELYPAFKVKAWLLLKMNRRDDAFAVLKKGTAYRNKGAGGFFYRLSMDYIRNSDKGDLLENLVNKTIKVEEAESIRYVPGPHKEADETIRRKTDAIYRLIKEGRIYSAIIESKKALSRFGFKSPFYDLLGLAYHRKGDINRAEEYFRKAYNTNTENPIPLIHLSSVYMEEGKTEKAVSILKDFINRYPDEFPPYFQLGRIFLSVNRLKDAKDAFLKALEINRELIVAHQNLGLIYQRMGLHEKAIESYENAISLNPNNILVINNLAFLYTLERKNFKKALKLIGRAKRLAPFDPAILDTEGWIYFQLKRYGDAHKSFLEAYEIDKKNPVIQYHIALTYEKLGEHEEAIEFLKTAVGSHMDFDERSEAMKLLHSLLKEEK
jgi:tetratricopeptide (TPR) repeat protein